MLKFKQWLADNEIGSVVSFYLPKKKNSLVKKEISDFFISNFNAFTIIPLHSGFWRKNSNSEVHQDDSYCYEVSLKEDQIKKLIDFLHEIREKVKEDSIYVKIGDKAYIINN